MENDGGRWQPGVAGGARRLLGRTGAGEGPPFRREPYISPLTTPLKRPKEGPAGPSFGFLPGVGRGGRLRGNYGGRRGRFAARRNGGRFFGGRSDGRGRALSRPGAGGLRGTGFRAGASLRTGHGMGIPATNGAKLVMVSASLSALLASLALAG